MSFAGIVEKVGPEVQGFKAGDRVATVRDGPKAGDPRFGAYQQYALASQTSTAKLGEEVALESGASSILNLAAVATALSIHMGLDRPSLEAGKPAASTGKKVLIYGGSSSAGGLATCYATAAGYEVVTTSSPQHKDYVSSLGATTILDHTQPGSTVTQEIASHGPYTAIFDTIGLAPVTDILVSYLESIGGGVYYSVGAPDKPLPAGVEKRFAPYSLSMDKPEHAEFRTWFYSELVPKGLQSRVIKPTRPQWLEGEGGLEQAQTALDLMFQDKVSGRKLLLDPSS